MKNIKKFAYKTPLGVVETQFHNLNDDLTSLREEVARLQTIENRLEVKVVKVLPETLEENVLYVVSDSNVADITDILSRLGSHDLDIQVINNDITNVADDLSSFKETAQNKFTEIDGRIDDTSEVIGLKTTELNAKLDTMQEDIDAFKEKMNEQKTDFTANIVQLQDLTAKHTNDIKTNADDIDALETALEEHKTSNNTDIARLDAKDAEQDALLAELTGQGSGLSILDLKDTVQQNTNNIANHETRITTLETNTTAHKESYDAYVIANNTRVKNLEDTEAEHNTDVNNRISTLSETINEKVDTNRTEFLNTMENVNATLANHDERITKNTTDIASLNEELQSSNASLLQTLEEKIDTGLANEADIRAKADTNLQDNVNEINLTDKNQNARLKALEDYTQNDFTSEIQNLKNRATALENTDVSLARKVQAIQQFSANHDSRLENLELNDHSYYNQRITALENTTKNQKNRLDGIDTLNTTQNNRLTAVETKNTEQDDTLGTHNERITDLEEHRENLEADTRAIARDELDHKLQDLEENYHDEMMTKVEDMTTDRLDELSTDYNNFKDTVENDIDTFKTQTNNSIQTFQGTLDTTLELVEDTQTEIKNTQAEQKTFLEEKTQAITDAQLVQDHYNQSYWEKFLQADEYNKELAEQQKLDKVNVYATNPNFSEEVVDTVTEYETVQEEIPEEERDPEHPEITTREVQKEVQKEVTHTVEHSQLNNSVALYEVESPSSEQTEFDLSDLQGRVQALEETKDDYKAAIQEVEEKFNNFDDQTAKIEELEGKLQSTKSQLGGLGNLHSNTVERVNNLEKYATLNDQKFNNYKTAQAEINTRQDLDLEQIHKDTDDLALNYDKLQTQNQDDVVVLRKVVDTPATDDTEETSHLELDSTEIIKVDDLVETKEELLKVRDLPVKGHKETYLRGETSEHLGFTNDTLKDNTEKGYLYTKEKYYNYNLVVDNAEKVIVSSNDNNRQKLEIRKENVLVTTPAVMDGETVVTPETSENVLKYFLYYVQTDEYINEEDETTYTEDTEIKICEVDPQDYIDPSLLDQDKIFLTHNYTVEFAMSLYHGDSIACSSLAAVDFWSNNGLLTHKSTIRDENNRATFRATDGYNETDLDIQGNFYISGYNPNYCRAGASWNRSPFRHVSCAVGNYGTHTYNFGNVCLQKIKFSPCWIYSNTNRYSSEARIRIWCDGTEIYNRTFTGLGTMNEVVVNLNAMGTEVTGAVQQGYHAV